MYVNTAYLCVGINLQPILPMLFSYKGNYDGLAPFYDKVIATVNKSDLNIDLATPYMEKYLNSPTDTPVEELITELWVALAV